MSRHLPASRRFRGAPSATAGSHGAPGDLYDGAGLFFHRSERSKINYPSAQTLSVRRFSSTDSRRPPWPARTPWGGLSRRLSASPGPEGRSQCPTTPSADPGAQGPRPNSARRHPNLEPETEVKRSANLAP